MASSYTQAINLCFGKVALIIDSDSRQAWLIPFLSVALHLCHRYMQLLTGTRSADALFASPATGGFSAAKAAMLDQGDYLVCGSDNRVFGQETLRHLFLRIDRNLLDTTKIRESPKQGQIFASELMAIVTDKPSPLKVIDVSGFHSAKAWKDLVDQVDVIAVASNIGQAIQPATVSGEPGCDNCLTLPRGHYLLAAHLQCLKSLSLQAQHSTPTFCELGSVWKLGPGLFWALTEAPWIRCAVSAHEPVWKGVASENLLQRTSSKHPQLDTGAGEVTDNGRRPSMGEATDQGVVVFGRSLTSNSWALPWRQWVSKLALKARKVDPQQLHAVNGARAGSSDVAEGNGASNNGQGGGAKTNERSQEARGTVATV